MDLPISDIHYLYYLAIQESKQRKIDEENRKKEQEEAKRLGKPVPPNIGGSMEDLEDVLMEGG